MPTRRMFRVILSLSFALVALTGCVPAAPVASPVPTPTATPSETPTPTPTPTPVPSVIVIDGDSVSVIASEGGTMVDIPFTTDAATAASQLQGVIGLAPTVSVEPANVCRVDTTLYDWGGIQFRSPGGFSATPGAQFLASSYSPATTNGIAVAMLSGQSVGAPAADVLAANAAAPTEGIGALTLVYNDVKSGTPADPDNYWGALAILQSGALFSFSAPVMYLYDC